MIILILGIALCVIGLLTEIDGIRRLNQATATYWRATTTFNRASETFNRAAQLSRARLAARVQHPDDLTEQMQRSRDYIRARYGDGPVPR